MMILIINHYKAEEITSLYSRDFKMIYDDLPDLYYINKLTAKTFNEKMREIYQPKAQVKKV